jgi:hypothetical protein
MLKPKGSDTNTNTFSAEPNYTELVMIRMRWAIAKPKIHRAMKSTPMATTKMNRSSFTALQVSP